MVCTGKKGLLLVWDMKEGVEGGALVEVLIQQSESALSQTELLVPQ